MTGFQLRLRGGNSTLTSYSGRVEVRVGQSGSWGTVCDDYFDHQDATVICKYLGYKNGIAKPKAHYGAGTGKIFIDDLKCSGTEKNPFSCTHRGWGKHNCNHDEDAGVICTGRGEFM